MGGFAEVTSGERLALGENSVVPPGLVGLAARNPALKRRAIVRCPYGTHLTQDFRPGLSGSAGTPLEHGSSHFFARPLAKPQIPLG